MNLCGENISYLNEHCLHINLLKAIYFFIL